VRQAAGRGSVEGWSDMDVNIARGPAARVDVLERELASDLGSDLTWLTSVLWPAADVRLSPARVPRGRRVAEAYRVIPNAARPRLLVPFSSPELVEGAMRRAGDGTTSLARSTHALRSRFAASSLGWARFPPFVVFFDRDPRPDELLTHHVRTIVDRPDAALAISFGPPRPDRKPVVQVLTLDGDFLGWGNVGWNEPTRGLLANEASVLRRWARHRPRTFSVPELLHEGPWQEHTCSVVSSPSADGLTAAVDGIPSIEVTREIASLGGTAIAPLASTPWWRSIVRRAASVREPTSLVLRWMHDLHGRRLVWRGSWHGSWDPRCLRRVGVVLHVGGWERSADGVPLGLDPIHFAFQRALRGGRDVGRASRVAIRTSAGALRALGVPLEDDPLLMACLLAELLVRLERSGRGSSGRGAGISEELLADLRLWVGRA
jgi:hypothetical protein